MQTVHLDRRHSDGVCDSVVGYGVVVERHRHLLGCLEFQRHALGHHKVIARHVDGARQQCTTLRCRPHHSSAISGDYRRAFAATLTAFLHTARTTPLATKNAWVAVFATMRIFSARSMCNTRHATPPCGALNTSAAVTLSFLLSGTNYDVLAPSVWRWPVCSHAPSAEHRCSPLA